MALKCLLDRLCDLEKISEDELLKNFKLEIMNEKELIGKRPNAEYTSIFHSVCEKSLYLKSSLQTQMYMIDQDPDLMGLIDSLIIVTGKDEVLSIMGRFVSIRNPSLVGILFVVRSKLMFLKDFLSNDLWQRTSLVDLWEYLLPKIRYTVYCIALFMLAFSYSKKFASLAILAIYLLYEIELQEQEIEVVCCDGNLKLKRVEGSTRKYGDEEIFGVVIRGCSIEVLDSMHNLDHHPQILNIYRELEHLKCFLEDLPKFDIRSLSFKSLLSQIAELNIKTKLMIHKLNVTETTEGMIIIMDSELPVLIEKANLIRNEIENIPPLGQLSMPSHFPLTNGLGFIVLVLEKLSNLLSLKIDWVSTIKDNIKLIYEELEKSSFLLMEISNQHTCNDVIDDLQTLIIQVAYKVEYMVDSIVLNVEDHSNLLLELYNVKELVMLINEKIATFHDEKKDGLNEKIATFHNEKKAEHIAPATSLMTTNEEVVGFEEEIQNVICQLIGGPLGVDVISIFGMPGLGKTTLAWKVYHQEKIIDHFDILAWYTVSQNYNKKELLIETYKQVCWSKDEKKKDFNLSKDDDADKLRKFLIGKRYLIVLDDLWDTKVWDDFSKLISLEEEQSSRIIITTRFDEVALYAECHSSPLPLRYLNHKESRKLLLKKIFQDGNFPQELSSIGKTILGKCHGLPLMIVLVAGILSRLGPEVSEWDNVAKNLSSLVASGEDSMKIIELSYKYLPDRLKPCFLYFGVFDEDEEVSVSKLIRLWIAEGFVRNNKQRILEDVAKDHLNELNSCSLVMVTKRRRCSNEAKACGVHDLVREFCLRKAKEENFLRVIREGDDLSPFIFDNYRLSIDLQINTFNQIRLSWLKGFYVHSLVLNSWCYQLIQPLDRFKLLRILDLSKIVVDYEKLSLELETLFHLRYLALEAFRFDKFPSNLLNLETVLVVIRNSFHRITLPQIIWRMVHLRHVNIFPGFLDLENYGLEFFEGSSDLENLQSIATIELKYYEDNKNIMKRFPNLRKLKCRVEYFWDNVEKCFKFPKLDFLCRLESLHMTMEVFNPEQPNLQNSQFKFYLPHCLKRFKLTKLSVFWKNISVISTLANLHELVLDAAFKDKVWNVQDSTFTNLKFLELKNLNILKWIASSDSFPLLEELVLYCCEYLKEVPSCFGEICTLRKIEINRCRNSAVKSVRKLKEEMEELLGLQLDIDIGEVLRREEDQEELEEEE